MPLIMHFTDVDNLTGIFAAGAVRCHGLAAPATNVGDVGIKSRRAAISVPCGPGGMVGDYVPFYFGPRSPMLYSIMQGNVPGVNSDQGRLVYLVTSTEAAYASGLGCVFTNGNAATYGLTRFEDDPTKLASHVDFELMKQQFWNNTPEDPDRKRRRMAEFLVHQELPFTLITEIGVRNATTEQIVQQHLTTHRVSVPVTLRPEWYF